MQALYGFLVFITPILVVVILLKLNHLEQRIKNLNGQKDENIELLIKLQKEGVLSKREVEEKVKEYKRKIESQRLEELLEKDILTNENYEQITTTLNRVHKLDDSSELKSLREKIGYHEVVCLPEKAAESWKCVCGTVNHIKDENCDGCHLNQNFIFREYNDIKRK